MKKAVGERLKELRTKLGLTQNEFGEKLGVGGYIIKNIEKNLTKLSLTMAKLISYEFNVNIDWLMNGKGNMFKDISQEELNTDFAKIPLVEAQLSAGGGSLINSNNIVSYYAFRKDWLQEKMISSKNAVLMKVSGDSMSPIINDSDIVLIDLTRTNIRDGKIYAIAFEEAIFLKKLQISHPEKLFLVSFNKDYPTMEIDKSEIDKLRIIGQCMWVGKNL